MYRHSWTTPFSTASRSSSIPIPPSVKLTNEAIKFSFPLNYIFCLNPLKSQLWILKANQGCSCTISSPSLFQPGPPTHSVLMLSSISWETEERGNEDLSEWNAFRQWFFYQKEISHVFSKKGLVLWMRSFQFPANLLRSHACVFTRLDAAQKLTVIQLPVSTIWKWVPACIYLISDIFFCCFYFFGNSIRKRIAVFPGWKYASWEGHKGFYSICTDPI